MNTNNEAIQNIVTQRKKAHEFYRKNSKVYQAFVEMEQRTYQDGALAKKHKELIATGISVVINCESCMEWHIKQAIDSGASQEEIIEAFEVGIEMSGGPGTVSARFAMDVLYFYLHQENERTDLT
ncbi:carboxymuconolactone decarboxylase family protein [Prolixibacter denitrificans]|uniref:AhpD family alkylhydroperoxidase n=1 Tax=Prolixibacter denitrificans TaxID=1541063 RepID=A0A2P8C7Y5_9BACT|nr:carboxymuconolactone decarboxylase family protein [Prolixibacter denitrificans]PSK81084.1 AhpD family alkylhydroperoxidase [Prolixibacter denitrificans]GET22201.1 alkyl hydroperoxide reductase AhpD [Prolixibacter denitrificans]